MIGFWGRAVQKECKRLPYDACGPAPRATRSCTWPALLALPSDARATAELAAAGKAALERATCRAVPRVDDSPWQRIKRVGEGSAAAGSSGADSSDAAAAGGSHWSGLAVPEARNHRFFVASLAEFREQIFHPPPVDG